METKETLNIIIYKMFHELILKKRIGMLFIFYTLSKINLLKSTYICISFDIVVGIETFSKHEDNMDLITLIKGIYLFEFCYFEKQFNELSHVLHIIRWIIIIKMSII